MAKQSKINDEQSWENFGSNFLKASDLKADEGSFVVTQMTIKPKFVDKLDKEVPTLELEVQTDDGDFLYAPNWTATKVIKEKVDSPRELIGARMFYKKVLVNNPQTGKAQLGITIIDVKRNAE